MALRPSASRDGDARGHRRAEGGAELAKGREHPGGDAGLVESDVVERGGGGRHEEGADAGGAEADADRDSQVVVDTAGTARLVVVIPTIRPSDVVKTMSATEASRSFAILLDEAERGGTIVVTRGGRRIATIGPATAGNGIAVAELLASTDIDEDFAADALAARELVVSEAPAWPAD